MQKMPPGNFDTLAAQQKSSQLKTASFNFYSAEFGG
jgi:hypothetical protein